MPQFEVSGSGLSMSRTVEQTRGEGGAGGGGSVSDGVFQRPRVGEQLIRRRLKYVQKTIRSGEPSGPSGAEATCRMGQSEQPRQPLLATINHRRAKSLPERAVPGSKRRAVPDTNQENGAALLSRSFGEPKTRRRKSSPLESASGSHTTVPEFSIEFPFSPLVTRTRTYAKLNSAGRYVLHVQCTLLHLSTVNRSTCTCMYMYMYMYDFSVYM